MKLIRTFFILFILILPLYTHAEQQITAVINPQTPAPYDKVTITLTSYSFDVTNSMITWKVDGKQFMKGVGIKSITLNTRGVGESTPVLVQITTPQGDNIESAINIIPQSVDIIWETPESYTPPFYEGKSLPGEGASVRVTAIPSLSERSGQIPANNLSYSWYVNDELMDSSSGYGKQSALLSLDYLNSKTEIKINVRSGSGISSEKTITIYPHEVMPILYTYNDVFGINRSKLISRRFETTNDFTVSLEPYYLSANNSLGETSSYTWLLDGLPITPQEKTLLAFHPKENSSGSKILSIILSNSKRRLQKAQIDLEILFDTRKQ